MNNFKLKRVFGVALGSFITVPLIYFLTAIHAPIVFTLVSTFLLVLLYAFLYTMFVTNPFIKMLEGEGMLLLDINSTGIITPYICKVKPPFLEAFLMDFEEGKQKKVMTTFDRDLMFYIKNPREGLITKLDLKKDEKDTNEYYLLRMKPENKTKAVFKLNQYPVFIYNSNLGTFITKDTLSEVETEGIIKHLVIYLKKKTEELTSIMRDFARYVIEMLKPTKPLDFLGKWWFWLLIGFILLVLGLLVFPNITASLSKNVVNTVSQNGSIVTTR